MIEIPPKFANRPPVSLVARLKDEGKRLKGKPTQSELQPLAFSLQPSAF